MISHVGSLGTVVKAVKIKQFLQVSSLLPLPRIFTINITLMPKCLSISLALLCSLAILPAQCGSQANPMVHQQGMDIVDGSGAKVRLRSVNLAPWLHWEGYLLGGSLLNKQTHVVDKLEQLLGKPDADRLISDLRQTLVTKEDIQQIAADGFNCVRVPVNCRQLDTDSAIGWTLLDKLADWCNEYHVYMVIDLHAAPGGQSALPTADPDIQHLWQSKPKQEETVQLWRRIAQHFKSNAMVAGYDLLNEPQPDDPYKLIELDKRIIKAIRSVDPEHMVIIEGIKLASDFSPFEKPLDRNMAYSFHMYTWFGDDRAKRLAVYGGVAHTQKVPMWVGEFGENSYQMIDSTLKMFAASDCVVGWSIWTWKRAAAKYPNLNVIEIPPGWKAVMDWVGNPFHKKPTQQEGISAMEEFIKAAAIQHVVADKQLTEMLQRY
jgi:endoglucanase